MHSSKALLIIDLQQGSFLNPAHTYDEKAVVNRINLLADQFRKADLPVIVIQHDGSLQNEYVPGTSDWELVPELKTTSADILIHKTVNDSFYKTSLKSVLDKLCVNELFITGCATDFCIDSTVQSALSNDYIVTVVKDGHTTGGERPHLSAKDIVNHYNMVWANLVPAAGKVIVKNAEEIDVT